MVEVIESAVESVHGVRKFRLQHSLRLDEITLVVAAGSAQGLGCLDKLDFVSSADRPTEEANIPRH